MEDGKKYGYFPVIEIEGFKADSPEAVEYLFDIIRTVVLQYDPNPEDQTLYPIWRNPNE